MNKWFERREMILGLQLSDRPYMPWVGVRHSLNLSRELEKATADAVRARRRQASVLSARLPSQPFIAPELPMQHCVAPIAVELGKSHQSLP